MSTFPLTKTHIDALIYATFTYAEDPDNHQKRTPEQIQSRRRIWQGADVYGKALWLLNLRTSTARWEDDDELEERDKLLQDAKGYTFEPLPGKPSLADTAKLLACYIYQSAYDDWEERPEWKVIDTFRRGVNRGFAAVHGRPPEPDDSTIPWALEDADRDAFLHTTTVY